MLSKLAYWAERLFFPLNKYLNRIAMLVLAVLMLLTVGDVIGRKLVGQVPLFQPIPGTFELTEFMMVLMVFAAIGYAQTRDEHISINVLTARFPPRIQAGLDSFIYLASLILTSLVTWQSVVFAQRIFREHDVSGVLKIPAYPFLLVVAAGMLAYSLALLVYLLRSLARLARHES